MRISPVFLLSLLMLSSGVAALVHGSNWQPDIEAPVIEAAALHQVVQPKPSDRIGNEAQLQVLTDRPLFIPRRRPQQPVAVATEEAEQQAAGTELVVPTVRGIGLSGQSSVAIVSLKQEENRPHRIAVGAEIDGWHITAIRRGSVTFSRETTEATVHLGKPGEEPVVEIVQREPELAEEADAGAAGVGAGERM